VVRQLEAEVGGVFVVPRQVAIVGGRGAEDHSRAKVVLAQLAMIAVAAGNSRLNGHPVANLQGGHLLAQLGHHSSCFVANDHRLGQHKVADASVGQIVNIRSADADTIHRQENLYGIESVLSYWYTIRIIFTTLYR